MVNPFDPYGLYFTLLRLVRAGNIISSRRFSPAFLKIISSLLTLTTAHVLSLSKTGEPTPRYCACCHNVNEAASTGHPARMDQPVAVPGIPGLIKLCDQLSFSIANLGQLDKILADLSAQCSEQKSVLTQLQPLLAPESRASRRAGLIIISDKAITASLVVITCLDDEVGKPRPAAKKQSGLRAILSRKSKAAEDESAIDMYLPLLKGQKRWLTLLQQILQM